MIEFRSVRTRYPEFELAVDFSIAEGELGSILGPSGSGKTTTLRLIAGFEQPQEGQILINGRDVTHLSPADRQIGYVFQDYTLFPHMSVGDNVGYGLRIRRRPAAEVRATVAELLDLVELPGYQDRNVATLSGGERQRVAIARALATRPVLLLLDEPFSSIDEVLRRDLRDEIVRLQKRLGITVVFVTHSRQEALAISDRVAVLQAGQVVQYAGVEELYRQPRDRFVAEFVGDANFVTGDGTQLLLRPEQLWIAGEGDGGDEGIVYLDAEIEMHQYLGSTHRYACRSTAGRLIVMDPRRRSVGDTVTVAYRPADGFPMTEGDPS